MHIQLQDPLKYVEEGQQARDGEAYFAMAAVSSAILLSTFYLTSQIARWPHLAN